MKILSYFNSYPLIAYSALSLLVAIAGFFPLFGLPGYVVYLQWFSILDLLGMSALIRPLEGDRAWPGALLISLLWPWFLPIAIYVNTNLGAFPTWTSKWLALIAIAYLVWSLLVVLLVTATVK